MKRCGEGVGTVGIEFEIFFKNQVGLNLIFTACLACNNQKCPTWYLKKKIQIRFFKNQVQMDRVKGTGVNPPMQIF